MKNLAPTLNRRAQGTLDRLFVLPREVVNRCADVLHDHYFQYHRGTMKVNGYKVVFGNDGFKPDNADEDIRSRLEVVKVVQTIRQINAFWKRPIFKITGFGLSEGSYTWALRVKTSYFNWDGILSTAVWDAWLRACGSVHPFPNRLRQEIRRMFIRRAP
ncbi:MAG: hypothetical protein ACYC0X_12205 [Pirellulaceae bacterium]